MMSLDYQFAVSLRSAIPYIVAAVVGGFIVGAACAMFFVSVVLRDSKE